MHFFRPLVFCVVASLAGVVTTAPLSKGLKPDDLANEIMYEAHSAANSASEAPAISTAAYGLSASAISVPVEVTVVATPSAAAPVAPPVFTILTKVVTAGGVASAAYPTSTSTASPAPAPANLVPSKESVSGMNPFTNPFWESWNAEWNRQKEAAEAAAAADKTKAPVVEGEAAAVAATTAATAAGQKGKDLSPEEQIAEDRRKQEEEIKKKIKSEEEKQKYQESEFDVYENLMPGCPPKYIGNGIEVSVWMYCFFGHEMYHGGDHWY